MTGSTHEYTRQHSATTGSSKMNKSYESQLRQCLSTNDLDSLELIPVDNQLEEKLFYKRKTSISDDDSGTEEVEQQLEQMLITNLNDNEDKLSIKSFGHNPDEGFSEYENQPESAISRIKKDIKLAKNIPDEAKKDFCFDTSVAFHGEFARLISIPLSLCHNVRYYLFAEEELVNEVHMNLNGEYLKLDNAKAQFKCPNTSCEHAWTSMRARISFSISSPYSGFIVLKIFGQNCQKCGTYANALWYIDEVCRVMKNLARSLFETYYPDMINNVDLENQELIQNDKKQSHQSRHDPTQRKGKMLAPHAKEHCEACRRGLCFI
ncbi:unnamed protein product [Rotaria sp. Silwood2]|nr:unnamed protein product [Rotaria sp. Silwood2]CAF2850652.1 unnamed protein product [Rotaria sp. Silwood2]CAF3147813.1 unnamed protein product [Rotaria sp. Silwood2]CAF3272130.1 unnamed protein product [Rotaria sp. Silwood2]CAF3949466.1 unnamed protein product [Rotaria sp. Silwood2]